MINNQEPTSKIQGCIKINTRGQIQIQRQFRIEVCGGERVILKQGAASLVGIYKPKDTAKDRVKESYEFFFKPLDYISKFKVDSEWCLIVEYALY